MIFVAVAKTESCDTYVFAYRHWPSHEEVCMRVYELEKAEDLDWYIDTTSVHVYQTEIED